MVIRHLDVYLPILEFSVFLGLVNLCVLKEMLIPDM